MEWNDMKVPPTMLAHRMGGLTTAVTELADKRIVMILDVERILAETAQVGSDIDEYSELVEVGGEHTVLFADDSSMARKQIETTLKKMGVSYVVARNGLEAWNKLNELAVRAETNHVPLYTMLTAIISDIEMPEMDGYVLTKKIKADPRFKGIPVIMHSSLSSEANAALGRSVGADFYIPKFNPKYLSEVLLPLLGDEKKTA
jgi:two-component system chemotaxis response regulator CheV